MLQTERENSVRAEQGVALLLHFMGNGQCALTRHPMRYERDQPVLLAGSALDQDDLRELLEVLQRGQPSTTPWLDTSILAASHSRLVWYEPSQVRPMWFRVNGKTIRYQVPWPALLFCAKPDRLAVAALASRRRPTPDTPLYHAPLFNIYPSGVLCLGNCTLPPDIGQQSRPAWNALIFDTINTHINHSGTLKAAYGRKRKAAGITTVDLLAFWRKLARAKATCFPSVALNPMGRRVAEFAGVELNLIVYPGGA